MKQKSILTQSLSQTQQLSKMQLELAKMVELPLAQLAQRIEVEMLDNEALEEDDADAENVMANDGEEQGYDEWGKDSNLDIEMGDYRSYDDIPSYLQEKAERRGNEREYVLAATHSFYDDLEEQIGEHNLSAHEEQLIEYLIGSLDERGFLNKDMAQLCDELAIYHNIYTDEQELERMLALLQTFEPKGIGARSLQECLHIQLSHPEHRSPWKRECLTVVDKYFKYFLAKKWDTIAQQMGLNEEQMKHIQQELTRLNPSPGRALNDEDTQAAPTILPDFYIETTPDGCVSVQLNYGGIPKLRVSRSFQDTISEYAANKRDLSRQQKDDMTYIRNKMEDAQFFINIVERRHKTMMKVMQSIVSLQHDFFDEDDESLLRPMTLKDVAESTGLDISTISRTVNSKYAQTKYGVYPLKFFFSIGFTSADGEELSARQIKVALQEIVDSEDKHNPMDDETIAEMLKERGYPIARRTVGKYRKQLNIPTSRFRKE